MSLQKIENSLEPVLLEGHKQRIPYNNYVMEYVLAILLHKFTKTL